MGIGGHRIICPLITTISVTTIMDQRRIVTMMIAINMILKTYD